MRHAAAGAARVLATTTREDTARAYALRRLRAVPEASPFHVGGERGWSVETMRSEGDGRVEVDIAGRLRPLPLLGVVVSLLGERDGTDVIVRVRQAERLRPEWLEGGYGDWVASW